jgi:hypothetical protein
MIPIFFFFFWILLILLSSCCIRAAIYLHALRPLHGAYIHNQNSAPPGPCGQLMRLPRTYPENKGTSLLRGDSGPRLSLSPGDGGEGALPALLSWPFRVGSVFWVLVWGVDVWGMVSGWMDGEITRLHQCYS